MLRLARGSERSASELAAAAGLSPSAASPHLRVLRDTGLMRMRVDAKRRLYQTDLDRLRTVRAALDELWDERLDTLRRVAEKEPTPRRSRRNRSA
jgi:DNA-binding transcriptional ArsR family regulator